MINNKKTAIIFLCIFFLFSTHTLFSQHIECEEIVFSFENISDRGLKIKATLKIDNLNNDTIALKTAVPLSPFGPRNLRVVGLINPIGIISVIPSWVERHFSSDSLADTQSLKFILSNTKSAIVFMEYDLVGSTILNYLGNYNPGFYTIQQRCEYFYPMNLPINKIKVNTPDSLKHFLSYQKDRDGKIKDINIAFIKKQHYLNDSIKGDKYKIGFYIPDTLKCDSLFMQKINRFQKDMNYLSLYMPNENISDIIFINWRHDKNAFGASSGSFVTCDVHFDNRNLLHEIIHSFFPIKVEESSKGQYFIGESIVEWLTSFISKTKIQNLEKFKKDSTSLYDIKVNNSSSWYKIYSFGPSIIERTAMQCGREKMAKIITSFFNENKNQVTNYDSFIKYLNMHLPNKLVKKLDNAVKGI